MRDDWGTKADREQESKALAWALLLGFLGWLLVCAFFLL